MVWYNAVMPKLLWMPTALGIALAGCEAPTDLPRPEPLPAPEPGRVVPVQPALDQSFFPVIGWDTLANALIAPQSARHAPTSLMRVDLGDLTSTTILPLPAGAQVLRTAGGSILYSNSDMNDGTTAALRRAGAGVLSDLTRVQFMISDNGKWTVFHHHGWRLMNLENRSEVALPPTTDIPLAISDDGSRVVFGILEWSPRVNILTVAEGTVKSVPLKGRVYDAAFTGPELRLLVGTSQDGDTTMILRFYDQSESGEMQPLGEWKTKKPNGLSADPCGAWSHGAEPRTAVVGVQETWEWSDADRRVNFLRLGDTVRVVASADLWRAADCNVSPDGRWFVFSASTGYYDSSRLFLKKIR